jgi:hypothetical protein
MLLAAKENYMSFICGQIPREVNLFPKVLKFGIVLH